jgi:hypothetical protein
MLYKIHPSARQTCSLPNTLPFSGIEETKISGDESGLAIRSATIIVHG